MGRASSGAPDAPRRAEDRASRWQRLGRPLLLAAIVATLWTLAAYFEVGRYLDKDHIRAIVAEAGWWGPLVFIAIFAVGELIHVPGLVFVAAAVMAWGRWAGIGASFAGAVVSATVGFLFARLVGGQALHRIRWAWARRQITRVDTRPVLTVTLLRMVFWMAPILNFALGMTRIRLRHYVIGTAVGLVPALLVTGLFFDWIVRTFL